MTTTANKRRNGKTVGADIARAVHDQWARRPKREGVLPALLAVAERVAEQVTNELAPPAPLPTAAVPLAKPLSSRERATLRGMAAGKSNAEIGRDLFVSEDTVKTHARRLFRKLGARDRAHAVAIGFHAELLTSADVTIADPPPLKRRTPGPPRTDLQQLRRDAGLTQQQTADRIGISRHAVSQWETGWRRISERNQARYVAAVTGVRAGR